MNQEKKNIVIMYTNRIIKEEELFDNAFQEKYIKDLSAECLKNNWRLVISTIRHLLDDNSFLSGCVLENNKWKLIKNITPDLIFDRSENFSDIKHGERLLDLAKKVPVINSPTFKQSVQNKKAQKDLFEKWLPKTIEVKNKEELVEALLKISTSKVVIKTYYGANGKGVSFFEKESVDFDNIIYPIVVQEFVSGYGKIPGTEEFGIFDVRIIYTNNKLTYSVIRIAEEGSYYTNVSKGGRPIRLDIKNISPQLLEAINDISKILKEKKGVMYCIDFMFENNKPYLIEVNAQPGVVALATVGTEEDIKRDISEQINLYKSFL